MFAHRSFALEALMIRALPLAFAAALVVPAVSEETAVVLDNFVSQVVDSDEVWLVRFSSETRKPWASVCNKLAPAWEHLAKSMKRIKTASIDVTERDSDETKLATRFGAMSEGLPNIKLFITKSDAPVTLLASESADIKKLKKRLSRHVKKLQKDKETGLFLKAPPRKIKTLDDATFDTELEISTSDANKILFVKFFRPQCNHCKALKPKWDAMGEDLKSEGHSNIVVAEVNCETQAKTCNKQGVSSHPTLIKYTKAMMKDEFPGEVYSLANEKDDMKEFVLQPEVYKEKLEKAIKEGKSKKEEKKEL